MVAEVGFDANVLMEYLKDVTDLRHSRGLRYSLPFLLAITILAKLAGQHKPLSIAQWVKLCRRQSWEKVDKGLSALTEYLRLAHLG